MLEYYLDVVHEIAAEVVTFKSQKPLGVFLVCLLEVDLARDSWLVFRIRILPEMRELFEGQWVLYVQRIDLGVLWFVSLLDINSASPCLLTCRPLEKHVLMLKGRLLVEFALSIVSNLLICHGRLGAGGRKGSLV